MAREYFEDCHIGDRVVTAGRTITETDIVMFAALTGDWSSLHTDAEYARTSIFGERIAHGMLTLVAGTALLFRLGENGLLPKSMIAIAAMEKVRFVAPVRIGDTIRLECEIFEMTKTFNQRGIIGLKYRIRNQRDEAIITARVNVLVGCRQSGEYRP